MPLSNYFINLLGTGFICFTATACDTTKYQELETASVKDGAFSQALVSEYREFAKPPRRNIEILDKPISKLSGTPQFPVVLLRARL